MQTRKAVILAHWHGREAEQIAVQYNPTEYTLDKQAQIGEITIPGLDAPLQQYVRGQAEKLTFDLFFDSTEGGMGASASAVTRLTDKIYQLIKIEPSRHAPPPLTFVWSSDFPGAFVGGAAAGGDVAGAVAGAAAGAVGGAAGALASAVPGAGSSALDVIGASLGSQRRNSFPCVMESIKQKFSLFSPAGFPLRATLTVTLREYRTFEDQHEDTPRNSPDRTHVHALQLGETLAAVARRYYDTPRDWRAVAASNGIDDARRVDPGVFLRVPRIR
jgi:hypothetical protein